MTTIGYATLQIIPSLKGVSGAIDKELRGVKPVVLPVDERAARRSGQQAGRHFSDAVSRETRGLGQKVGNFFDPSVAMGRVGRTAGLALKGALLGSVAGVGATIAGTVGLALTKGFERLRSIDDAKAKLKALGNSAADVQKIMDSALESVDKTKFSLGDAATVAANAVAAGVKPGQDLTKYLKTTADAAAVAGTELSDMGRIINQVHTGQKAYTEDLNQLADRGIPIYQWLSDQLHISAADVKQFAADGKISSADFETAISTHIGGAAVTMGDSFSGAVDKAEAALSRLGAAFLQPVFGNAAGGLGSVTTSLDGLKDWIVEHQDSVIGFWETLGEVAITGAENFAHGVGGALQALGDLVGGLGNVKGVLDSTMAFFADLRGDHAAADEFRKSAQEAFGWGEAIRAAGDKLVNANFDGSRQKVSAWADAARDAAAQSRNAAGEVAGLGTALGVLPPSKTVSVDADTGPAEAKMQTWWDKWKSIIAAPPAPTPQGPVNPLQFPIGGPTPGRAGGGPIHGPGGPKSDIIPIWASNGEHMLSAKDVAAMGGQAGVYAFRNALHRSGGGDIFQQAVPWGVDPHGGSDAGKAPSFFAPWWDMDWMPPENPQRVGDTPGGWWWHHGPTHVIGGSGGGVGKWFPPIGKLRPPRPGERVPPWMLPKGEVAIPWGFAGGGAIGPDIKVAGGFVGTTYSQANRTDCSGMVARVINGTLGMPDGGLMTTKNAAEWLAARGFKPGIGGPGQISVGWYDHGPNPNDGHMAMTLSDGSNAEAGGNVGDIFQIGGGAAGAGDPEFDQHMFLPTIYGEGAAGSSSPTSSPFAGGSAAAAMTGGAPASSSAPSSGGGSSSSGGQGLPSSIPDLAKLPFDALGDFASGQVSSLLDVFGVNGTPGWLKGVSQFIGGIKVSDKDGNAIFDGSNLFGSAAPLSASPTATGTPPPTDAENMHGNRAGQAPGPGVTYNITARDTEDAFIKAQRIEREKAAAKLSRF